MKTKIVELSRNDRGVYLWTKICLVTLVVVFIISFYVDTFKVIAFVMAIIGVLLSGFDTALEVINRQDDEIIRKNKLINIVFSDIKAVDFYITTFLVLPAYIIIFRIIEMNLVTIILYIVPALIIMSKGPRIISDYFKKKLS